MQRSRRCHARGRDPERKHLTEGCALGALLASSPSGCPDCFSSPEDLLQNWGKILCGKGHLSLAGEIAQLLPIPLRVCSQKPFPEFPQGLGCCCPPQEQACNTPSWGLPPCPRFLPVPLLLHKPHALGSSSRISFWGNPEMAEGIQTPNNTTSTGPNNPSHDGSVILQGTAARVALHSLQRRQDQATCAFKNPGRCTEEPSKERVLELKQERGKRDSPEEWKVFLSLYVSLPKAKSAAA